MPLTDESLVAGVAAGDAEAAAALVRRYQARAFGLALTIVGDRGAAEDVAQEGFLRLWQHAGTFDARRGTVGAWLLSVVRNAAIDVVRLRRQEPYPPEEVQRLAAAVAPAIAGVDDGAGDRRRVGAALAALPEEQRRAVVLAVFGGCTAAEVAAVEGIPVGTAKSRIRLAFSKLRATFGVDDERL